jgi:hypothetical protein
LLFPDIIDIRSGDLIDALFSFLSVKIGAEDPEDICMVKQDFSIWSP